MLPTLRKLSCHPDPHRGILLLWQVLQTAEGEEMSRRTPLSNHHRRPRSKGGTREPENISRVQSHRHRAWHTLFQDWSPYQIADEINRTWLDTRYEFVVVPRQVHSARFDER